MQPGELRPVCSQCDRVTYIDPKLAAAAIYRHEEGIVLVRRAIEPGYGLWAVPGGFVDRGEEVPKAAQREAFEETGVEIELDDLLGVYSYEGWTSVVVFYEGRIVKGTPEPRDETLEVKNFAPENLPWDEIAFYSTHDALRDYLKKHQPGAVPQQPSPSVQNPRGKGPNT